MNKKGGEKWLSVWWIFVLAIIGGAIVIGVLIYYNQDINAKEFEADILAERIMRCILDNGYLREDFLEKDFDVYKECGFNQEVFEKTSNFYFDILVEDEEGEVLGKEIPKGDVNIRKNCDIVDSGDIGARHFPRCVMKEERVLYYKDCKVKVATLIVVAGSDQDVRRAPLV